MSILFPAEVRTAAEHGRHTARLCAAMEQHIVELLRHGFSVVLDFHANTVTRRAWMRSVIAQAGVAHELHVLDTPDDLCKRRLRERNARGDHPYQVSEETYDIFMSYFVPPEPSEGFNIIVHTP